MTETAAPAKKAPTKSSGPSTKKAPPEVPEGHKLCKHCKHTFPIAEHPTHSKECLREKQARQQEKKQARESATQEKDVKKPAKPKKGQDKDGTPAVKAEGASKTNPSSSQQPSTSIKKPPSSTATSDNKPPTLPHPPGARKSLPGQSLPEKPIVATNLSQVATAEDSTGSPSASQNPAKKTNIKKRKAEKSTPAAAPSEAPPPKKKKKEDPAKKVPKPKGPVDVEKQCGVELPNGLRCARSLTCKSHSMGAKRAVQGRSLPYDILLQAYNKRNQAKLQRLAIEGNTAREADSDQGGVNGNGEAVDSDEEVALVMGAISKGWGGRPLSSGMKFGGAGGWNAGVGTQGSYVSVRKRFQNYKLREAASNAFGNAGGGNSQVVRS